MIRRIGLGVLLSTMLVTVAFGADEANRSNHEAIKSSVVPYFSNGGMTYQQGIVAASLPHWWQKPGTEMTWFEFTRRHVITPQDMVTKFRPEPMSLIGPRGPIIMEEEPLLGID